ncbi:MAG: hypothetical protein AAFV25_15120 [Bacteroidota bacterium]
MSKQLESGMTLQDSWQQLIQEIELYDSGVATVEALSSGSAKNGLMYTVKWGAGESTNSKTDRQSSMKDMMEMFAFFNSMQEQRYREMEMRYQDKLNLEIERVRTDHKIKDLEGQMEAIQEMPSNPALDGLERIVGMVSGLRPNPPVPIPTEQTQIGVAGQAPAVEGPKSKHKLDINGLVHTSRIFSRMYPEYNVNELLNKLVGYIHANRQFMDGVIQNLMKNEAQPDTPQQT